MSKKVELIPDEEAADWMLREDDSTVDTHKYDHLSIEELDKLLEKFSKEESREATKQ